MEGGIPFLKFPTLNSKLRQPSPSLHPVAYPAQFTTPGTAFVPIHLLLVMYSMMAVIIIIFLLLKQQ
jgi:hypothetical protein